MRIRAELDTTPLERAVKRLGRASGRRVLQRSIRGGVRAMEREATTQAYRRLNAKRSDIRKAISRGQVRGGATSGAVRVRTRPIPLIAFKARQTPRGVMLQIERGGKRVRLRHSFIATMPSGHRGVFQRGLPGSSKNRRKPVPRRGPPPHRSYLPIDELFGKQVIQVVDDEKIAREILRVGEATFVRELQRLVDVEAARG